MSVDLQPLLAPRSLAVAGATANPDRMGSRALRMFAAYGFEGPLYAVNPRGDDSAGQPGYPRVSEIPELVDLCVVATPPSAVPDIVRDCAAVGVPIVQVLTSGPEGSFELDAQIVEAIAGSPTRVIGPNCIGTHSPVGKTTFVVDADTAAGSIALISQSGGLSLDLVNQARSRRLALRGLVSAGNCADVSLSELVDHFAADDATSCIGIYLEGVPDAMEFVASLRAATAIKPVVMLKGGRSEVGARSAASHTGAVAISHDLWDAVMRQVGVIEARSPDDLLARLAALRSGVPPLRGNRLALLGNGGGMTVLATDELASHGLEMAALDARTRDSIDALDAPPGATLGNPSDLPAGALNASGIDVARRVIGLLLRDPNVDGVLVHFNLLALLNYADPQAFATTLAELLLEASDASKPLFAAVRATPDPACERLRAIVTAACGGAGIPTFATVQEAVSAAAASLARTRFEPSAVSAASGTSPGTDLLNDVAIDAEVRSSTLPMRTGREILEASGITCVETRFVRTEDEAAKVAVDLGFPIVLKLDAAGLSHKSDVGAVRLGLGSEPEVRAACGELLELGRRDDAGAFRGVLVQRMVHGDALELLIGFHRDPVLGAMVLTGLGGTLVEVMNDVTSRMPPVDVVEARRMLSELRGASLFEEFRGRRARDLQALADMIARFSQLAATAPHWLEAVDLNPVLVLPRGEGAVAVDWRFSVGTHGHRSPTTKRGSHEHC